MTLVRILKNLGFEQPGDIVDYRGNLEEALVNGDVELLDADPRPVVNSETLPEEIVEPEEVIEPEAPVAPIVEEEPVAPVEEVPTVTPEVEGE